MINFDGRVVIVTGAGKGLGRAYALDLAARGAKLVLNNRRREVDAEGLTAVDHVVREIRANSIVGDDGVAHDVDVIILGTGFEVSAPPIAKRVRGRTGKRAVCRGQGPWL